MDKYSYNYNLEMILLIIAELVGYQGKACYPYKA
jgi:hypothetical protein